MAPRTAVSPASPGRVKLSRKKLALTVFVRVRRRHSSRSSQPPRTGGSIPASESGTDCTCMGHDQPSG